MTMRILGEKIKKRGEGQITLIPENLDDLWLLYNILTPGDIVYAQTFRRVKFGEDKSRSERISMFLGIEVTSIAFDKYSTRLRVKGKIIKGPERLCSIGSFHTLNISPNTKLTIHKRQWPKPLLEKLYQSTKRKTAEAVIVAIDSEEATIAKLTDYTVTIKTTIYSHIPGKTLADGKTRLQALKTFLGQVAKAISENVTKDTIGIIIAGPADTKNKLYELIKEQYPQLAGKCIIDTVSDGTQAGVNEVLKRGAAIKMLKKLRIAMEEALMEEIFERIAKDGNVAYTLDDVEKAAEIGAVETLLITNNLFTKLMRENPQRLEKLLENVEQGRGKVHIVDIDTNAGMKLKAIGEIAALLRYKIYMENQ